MIHVLKELDNVIYQHQYLGYIMEKPTLLEFLKATQKDLESHEENAHNDCIDTETYWMVRDFARIVCDMQAELEIIAAYLDDHPNDKIKELKKIHDLLELIELIEEGK